MLLLVWGKEEVNVFYSVDNILEALCAFLRTASHWLQYPSVITLTTRLRPCSSDLRNDWLLCKARCPMSVKEGGPYPVEQALAPTVVESNVPERTRRRGEYSARVCGREITVSFFVPPLHSNNKNKPNLILGGSHRVFWLSGGGKRGAASFFFFFRFFPLFLKRRFCASRWFVLRSRRKDDGRRGRSEGATEAESRLFNAIIEREEAHDQFAKSLRHLHTPREASGWR